MTSKQPLKHRLKRRAYGVASKSVACGVIANALRATPYDLEESEREFK